MIKVMTLVLTLVFTVTQMQPVFATQNLSVWLAHDQDPMRDTRNDIAGKLKPGAIGNGQPLIDLVSGALPERISLDGSTENSLREAIDLAIELHLRNRSNIATTYEDRADQALADLYALKNELRSRVHIFDSLIEGPEDYLLGFNAEGLVGLSIGLVKTLHSISPELLAQYIYHECIPEHYGRDPLTKETDREEHRRNYKELQTAIFGEEAVSQLGRIFRDKIMRGEASKEKLTVEQLLANADNIQAIAFDMGNTLTVKTLKDPKAGTPEDKVIESLAKLIQSGIKVVIISRKSYEEIRPWIEGKLAPMLSAGDRGNFKAYCDRITKLFTMTKEGRLAEENRISFSASVDRKAVLEALRPRVGKLQKALLSDMSLSGDIKNIIRDNSLEAKSGDEYVQVGSSVNIDVTGDKTGLRARERIRDFVETVLLDAGLMADDIIVDVGSKGAFVRSAQANRSSAIRHLREGLNLSAGQIVYVADQFAGKAISDLPVSETGVYCLNVGADINETDLNVINYATPGPSGTTSFIEDFVNSITEKRKKNETVSRGIDTSDPGQSDRFSEDVRMGEEFHQMIAAETTVSGRTTLTRRETETLAKAAGLAVKRGIHVFNTIPLHMQANNFSKTLAGILRKNPDKTYVIAVDRDLGEGQHSQLMEIFTALDEIEKMFPNLKLIRRSGSSSERDLASEINTLMGEEKVDPQNIFMVVKKDNLEAKRFENLEGRAWISAIDNSMPAVRGEGAYIPIFEAAAISMLASINADTEAIKKVYDSIAMDPETRKEVTLETIEGMIRHRVLYLLPRIEKIPLDDLRMLYERVRAVYMAA